MSVILLVLGILVSAAGGALIGFGLPIRELSHGATLILAGVFALVGGLLLVGLSALVSELARVTVALKLPQAHPTAPPAARAELPAPATETVAREPAREPVKDREPAKEPDKDVVVEPAAAAVTTVPSSAAISTPAPASALAPAVEVSTSAIERLRSTISRSDKVVPEADDAVPLSPNGQHAAHPVDPPLQVEPAPVLRSAGAAAVETREPRLDFLFRPRHARQAQNGSDQHAPQHDAAFDSLWPRRPARGQPDQRPDAVRLPAVPAAAAQRDADVHVMSAPAAPPHQTVAILKSGVVDGMAYTLYADGSIEAQLPQGTVRFGSIAELRAHIETNA